MDATNNAALRLDLCPLGDAVKRFRDAYVAICNRPSLGTRLMDDALDEIEQEVKMLRAELHKS